MLANRVLRRIFGPKRDEVTGGWRKFNQEQLHNLYSSPSIMKWVVHVARMGIMVGKPEGKKQLGRQRRRWVDNIKIDHREIGWGGMDWINLAQDIDQWRALVYTVMNLRVP
jgi:hypothetical protein